MTDRNRLLATLTRARERTWSLVEDLNETQLRAQPDPLFSPIGWHLGHVVWQEELWAWRRAAGRAPLQPKLDAVLDAFRSEKTTRGARIPPVARLRDWAEEVRAGTLELLERSDFDPDQPLLANGWVFHFLANHEAQHAEIIATVRFLADLPMARPEWSAAREAADRSDDDWVAFEATTLSLGDDHDPDGWDNERGAHPVEVGHFELRRHPVTNGDWLEFMRAGGYDDDALWDEAGRAFRDRAAPQTPLGWHRGPDGWLERTLGGARPLEPRAPVSRISHHEARAFARFAGARLPTEAEWELAASVDLAPGAKRRFPWGDARADAELELVTPAPAPVGAFAGARSARGLAGLCGGVWEWTDSVFAPYPRFEPGPYVGYSKPWFDGAHRVARGGCFATALGCARNTFRNWYLPELRQPALGLRLARTP